ncbi:hypothetical protein [Deinococcus radiophilus]|uniref:hypothetical protein n=1 Tax=Deinococcus radiophilus TaxID=32062 RepID=UPI003610F504
MIQKTKLTYVTDTYCIWCWGFGEALRGFADANADQIELEVLPGGLLVGERVQAVGQKEGVLESAQRMTEMTGVATGEGFRDAVQEGSTVLDSGVAARAFWASTRWRRNTGWISPMPCNTPGMRTARICMTPP